MGGFYGEGGSEGGGGGGGEGMLPPAAPPAFTPIRQHPQAGRVNAATFYGQQHQQHYMDPQAVGSGNQ